jgi:hypothetical protein
MFRSFAKLNDDIVRSTNTQTPWFARELSDDMELEFTNQPVPSLGPPLRGSRVARRSKVTQGYAAFVLLTSLHPGLT